VSGEDWFSYDVLTGKKLSTICEELMPHFFNAASYLFTGKELKREKEIGRYWPKIVYLLIDSQNHPDSVITNTLFIESKSKNVDVAKYLLQQTPTTGYAYTAIYEPSEDLLSHIRERADKFKEKCELPTLSKKLDLTKFKEYSTSLIFFILSHKLKGEKVENYIENLRKMAKINPDFLPTLYNIEERVKTAISMSY
jgi:hypothetical protein